MANLQLNKYFKIWHLALLTTLILLVSIGGFTRLTNSGLSMVDWKQKLPAAQCWHALLLAASLPTAQRSS